MKKILIVTSILISCLLSSCATKPVKLTPLPKRERLKALKKALQSPGSVFTAQEESEDLAQTYLQALDAQKRGDNKTACNLFSDLSKQRSLAVRDAALVRVLSTCDFSTRELINLWEGEKISPYLEESYYEASRSLAFQRNLLPFEADFSFALIKFKKTQAEKIKLVNRSMAIAEEIADQKKIELYTKKRNELSPLYNAEVNEKNIYLIAKDFESNRNFTKARELYQQIIDGNFLLEEKIKAYNSYRISFKVQRDLKTFLIKTYEMEKFLKNEVSQNPEDQKTIEFWVDSKIALARAVWTDHQNLEARKILDELLDLSKGSINQLATAHYVYGSLHLENKENAEALKRFEKANSLKVSDLSLLENIQWAIVWNHYLLRHNRLVLTFAETFSKKSNNPNFVAKLNYWRAKAFVKLGRKVEAKTVFEELFKSDSFGYYGILSSIELEKPLNLLPPQDIFSETSGNEILDWLIAMEEKIFSQKLLKEIDSQFKTPQDREKAMGLYGQTEWYQGGMRQIYNFKMAQRNLMTEKYINVVFPTPYRETVEKMSQKYSVPQELIYAIARQESAFVASERSWADAFGLMQLIPEKGAELSKKYSIPYHDYNDLYNPDINIEMGTALLKRLREKFHSQFAQSTAAYNASEDVIKTWEKERFNGNYFEFIEMIPYEETRNYIKLVFRNYITYKRILNKEEFTLDKNFFAKPFN